MIHDVMADFSTDQLIKMWLIAMLYKNSVMFRMTTFARWKRMYRSWKLLDYYLVSSFTFSLLGIGEETRVGLPRHLGSWTIIAELKVISHEDMQLYNQLTTRVNVHNGMILIPVVPVQVSHQRIRGLHLQPGYCSHRWRKMYIWYYAYWPHQML